LKCKAKTSIFTYMIIQNHLTVVFEPAAEGGFVASIPEMPGVSSQGETLEEARENVLDALQLMLEVRREEVSGTNSTTITESLYLAAA
jgi:predicted RNase H-like HicB family nuclease